MKRSVALQYYWKARADFIINTNIKILEKMTAQEITDKACLLAGKRIIRDGKWQELIEEAKL